MGNHYPECGACQPVRQAADAPKLHTPSRACTSWEQREHKAAALRKIAFLAISEAHQVFHWLPAALCLARHLRVEVSVLSPSRTMFDFLCSYDEKFVFEDRKSKRLNYSHLYAACIPCCALNKTQITTT